jgi:hypothetical protein
MEKDFFKSLVQRAETSTWPNATVRWWPARSPARTGHTWPAKTRPSHGRDASVGRAPAPECARTTVTWHSRRRAEEGQTTMRCTLEVSPSLSAHA